MRIIIRPITAIALLACCSLPLYAISEGGAIFLMIRPGARASGMGSAFCAIADDATATYFNPAGLAYLASEPKTTLAMSDVKDWTQLVRGLQGSEADYSFQAGDLKDPAGLAVRLGGSPFFIASDILDWQKLMAALQDTSGRKAGMAWLRTQLGSDALAAIDGYSPTARLTPEQQARALSIMNGLLTRRDLFKATIFSGYQLPDSLWQAVDRYTLATGRTVMMPQDIAAPRALAQKIESGSDPLAAYLKKSLSAKGRLAVAKAGAIEPDSLSKVLAAELSRIVRGQGLYQEARFKGAALKATTRALLRQQSRGDDLTRLNLRLLADAYPMEVELWFDRATLLTPQLQQVNRWLLEAVVPDAVAKYQERTGTDPFVIAVQGKMAGVIDSILTRYDGQSGISTEDENLLISELNKLVADRELATGQDKGERAIYQGNRLLLEQAFLSEIKPLAQTEPRSAVMHLRRKLDGQAAEVAGRSAGSAQLDDEAKQQLLDGLNRLLGRNDLYDQAFFPRAAISAEARGLVADGIEELSAKELVRLNRLLIEAAFPAAIVKADVEEKGRYATLMHSPWLSEIWKDVGDMYYEFIAYAQPVKDWGVFGGNVVFLSEGKNQHLDEQGNVLGEFSSYEFSPSLSYGNKLFEDLAGGLNLKIIHSHLAPFGPPGTQGKGIATTWAVDLGMLYKGPVRGLSFGANLQNLGPKLVYIDAQQADELTRNIRAGTAYRLLDGKHTRLTLAYDLSKTVVYARRFFQDFQEAVHHVGTEYWYLGPVQLALRYGLVYDKVGHIGTDENGKFKLGRASSYGGSVGYHKIAFDFAMEPGGDLQEHNKKFALSFNF